MLIYPSITIDLAAGLLHDAGGERRLSKREVEVLQYLIERQGKTISRQELEREVWGFRAGVNSEAVPVAMRRLRNKLEPDRKNPQVLHLHHKFGWRVVAPPEAEATKDAIDPRANEQRKAQGPRFFTPFWNWDDRLQMLKSAFQEGFRLVTLVGEGGVGKTRLAAELARNWEDGSYFIDLEQIDSSKSELLEEGICRAMRVDEPEQVLNLLYAQPALLVLDNAEHITEATMRWLESARGGQAVILVTSRSPLGMLGEKVVPLEPPDERDARLFFLGHYGRVAGDDEVTRLLAIVGHTPMALQLCAGMRRPVSKILTLLEEGKLDEIQTTATKSRQESLDHMVRWSWSMLDEQSRQTIAMASLFASRIDFELLNELLGRDCEEQLFALLERSLIAEDQQGYRVRPLVRLFCREKNEPKDKARFESLLAAKATALLQTADQHPAQTISGLRALSEDLARAVDSKALDVCLRSGRALSWLLQEEGWAEQHSSLLGKLYARQQPTLTDEQRALLEYFSVKQVELLQATANLDDAAQSISQYPSEFVEIETALLAEGTRLSGELFRKKKLDLRPINALMKPLSDDDPAVLAALPWLANIKLLADEWVNEDLNRVLSQALASCEQQGRVLTGARLAITLAGHGQADTTALQQLAAETHSPAITENAARVIARQTALTDPSSARPLFKAYANKALADGRMSDYRITMCQLGLLHFATGELQTAESLLTVHTQHVVVLPLKQVLQGVVEACGLASGKPTPALTAWAAGHRFDNVDPTRELASFAPSLRTLARVLLHPTDEQTALSLKPKELVWALICRGAHRGLWGVIEIPAVTNVPRTLIPPE